MPWGFIWKSKGYVVLQQQFLLLLVDSGTSLTGKWRIGQEIYLTKQVRGFHRNASDSVLVPPCNFSICSVWKQSYKEGLNDNSVFHFYRLTNCWQVIKTYIFPLQLRNPTCALRYAEGVPESILCKHIFVCSSRRCQHSKARFHRGFCISLSVPGRCKRCTAGGGRLFTCRWQLKLTGQP